MRTRSVLTSALLVAAFTVLWPAVAAASFFYDPHTADAGAHTGFKAARTGLKTALTPNGSWLVYHHDDAHTGFDPSQQQVSSVRAGWTSSVFDAQVYASPVIYGGLVFAVTLNNTVYALNQTDGSVQWSHHLGTPTSGGWGCGNVSPQGIIGTPVIDPIAGRIYVAWLDSSQVYWLEGLRLADGLSQLHTAITTPASDFDWTIEQERGALGIANGYVYVPFGGRAGDCGNYHGYVFGVPTSGAAVTNFYETPGSGSGFWAAGGVVIDDSTGKVFATSGNAVASGCNANPNGSPQFENDAVVRLSASLAHEDFFMPQDWHDNWCINDQDLGGASSVLISPNLMFQAGKWGTGFLLNPNSLGGVGGQLFPAPHTDTADVCLGNHGDANFASYAYAKPYVYLSCEGNGIVALQVTTTGPSFSLCTVSCDFPSWQGSGGQFGPPIVAAGAVWAIDINGGGLFAFRANSGALIYQSAGFGTLHFVTPAEAGGQVFAPAGARIKQFVMSFGDLQAPVPGPPPSHGTPVVPTPAATPPTRQPVAQSTPTPPPVRR